jgi:nitroimidazol reductase NimA-like FMN-containing flavoprotein (pyridoxamine 5'-phosphate oxidase superfamily)
VTPTEEEQMTPQTELDARYSEPGAAATSWEHASELLAAAELSWITTVRPDGRPHVTPLITVLVEDTVHFCTGPEEQKGRNLAQNPAVVLITGANTLHGGTDVVLEGDAERVTGREALQALADAWVEKYGEEWRFEVTDDVFLPPGGGAQAWVYGVRPTRAYGFGKAPYSHTRWTFRR